MSRLVEQNGDRRAHVESDLMRESLVSKRIRKQTDVESELRILPDVNIIAIGGQSLLDRGRKAMQPLLDAIVECRANHKFVLAVGGGARVRHTFHICLDLGIPLGGLAMVAGAVDEQNTRMLATMLAKHKGIALNKDHFLDLPLWLESGMIPIMTGMPPYHYWEPPAGKGRVPVNGNDLGTYMIAEVLGARSMIFLKDEDGLYTDNPKTNPDAEYIARISPQEILERKFPDLIVEQAVLETMVNAHHMRQIQIVNGLKPERLEMALAGDPAAGTVIDADL